MLEAWRDRARDLRREVRALGLAARDPRTPWYARLVVLATVGYALSPVDPLPDVLPVVGHLDELVVVPVGVALAVRLTPEGVLADCRERAADAEVSTRARWVVAALVAVAWGAVGYALAAWLGLL